MTAGVRPENPKISPEAKKANMLEGYGPNNPEPMQFHITSAEDAPPSVNALHAAEEYIARKQQ